MSTVLHQLMSVLGRPQDQSAAEFVHRPALCGRRREDRRTKSRRRPTSWSKPPANRATKAGGTSSTKSSDLIYHLLVLLAHHNIKLEEVETEIARRFGQSGLDEKAARTVMAK